jgi:hypothetical protein
MKSKGKPNTLQAQAIWSKKISQPQAEQLRTLLAEHNLSVAAGDVQFLNGRLYVTHSGLLRLASKNRCSGIETEIIREFCNPVANRWVIKATIFKTPRSKGFVGYGDADPSNVSPLVRGAEMRIAETRAVNRALRKAYGIGICSLDELGTANGNAKSSRNQSIPPGPLPNASSLRDRLLFLIRQHQLDAEQVKLYAAQFCGAASVREASRDKIENFVQHLTTLAAEGRDRLVGQMNASLSAKPASAEDKSSHEKEAA